MGLWTIEPFPGTSFGLNHTQGSDIANIAYFIDLTRSSGLSIRLGLHKPRTTITTSLTGISQYQTVKTSRWSFAKQYFDNLYDGLNAHYANSVNIKVIPIGSVLNRLDTDFKAGLFSEISDISTLYSDDYHLNSIGRFVAAATIYATITQSSPENIDIPSYVLTPGYETLTNRLETIVWDVVSNDLRTGVAPVPTSLDAKRLQFDEIGELNWVQTKSEKY